MVDIKRQSWIADSVLVVCAVVVAALVVKRELFSNSSLSAAEPRQVKNWLEIAQIGHLKGRAESPVRLVEFSDFQCPFCAQLQTRLRRLQDKYPHVAIVYRHFPLSTSHPHAYNAALASECAAAQGRFTEYHDALYAEQGLIGQVDWATFGRKAGVRRIDALVDCIKNRTFAHRVDADLAAAKSLGLLGTPTVIVDGVELVGATLAQLEARVESAVRRAEQAARRAS